MIFPNLPYKKTDRVAELDAPRPSKMSQPKKQAPAVPARRCSLSPICALRKSGNCDALHCKDAADYTAALLYNGKGNPMKFYGTTYWYPTPNNGIQEIGVTTIEYVIIGSRYRWLVAWFNGVRRYSVRSPHLGASADPDALQERLDSWAAKRQLKRCAISSR